MQVFLVTRDLMFPSRVRPVADSLGLALTVESNPAAIPGVQAGDGPSMVMIDLELPQFDAQQFVEAARGDEVSSGDKSTGQGPTRTLIGYAPHGQVNRIKAAREAGFDVVMTRGQFDQQVAVLLEDFKKRASEIA